MKKYTISHILKTTFPIISQLQTYSWNSFFGDLLSSFTVAFVAIAYAALANVPPNHALLSAVYPVMLYALFGKSAHLSFGPEAFSSLVVGQAILSEVERTGEDPIKIVAVLTCMVGVFCIILAILRAGFIENILSGFLLEGFVCGVAVLIMTEQVPELLGLHQHHFGNGGTISKILDVGHRLHSANLPSVYVGVANVLFLIIFQQIKCSIQKQQERQSKPHPLRFITYIPEILILVVVMLGVSYQLDFENAFHIRILGKFDNSIPPPGDFSPFSIDRIQALLGPVVIVSLAGFIECQTITKCFRFKEDCFPNVNHELFAFGIANLVGSFFGAYVTFGSLPRSRILFNSGGKTMLSGLMTAIFVLLSVVYLAPILVFLPKPTLASIVFIAAYNLIEWHHIYFIIHIKSYNEIAQLIGCFFLSLILDIQTFVLGCLLVSALVVIQQNTKIELSLMGRILDGPKPLEWVYSDAHDTRTHDSEILFLPFPERTKSIKSKYLYVFKDAVEDIELIPNIIIISVQTPLLFYNVNLFRSSIKETRNLHYKYLEEQGDRYFPQSNCYAKSTGKMDNREVIILDFKHSQEIDSAALHSLKVVFDSFTASGTRIMVSGLNLTYEKAFNDAHLIETLGKNNVHEDINSAVERIERRLTMIPRGLV